MRRPSRQERRPQDPRQDDIRPGIPPITIDEGSINENRLHPLGIPGINFLEPDLELVDPWDWFLTPAKGNDIGVDAIEITESSDGCVVCISVRPTLLWLTAGSGGGTGFCIVKPECRRPPEPPVPPIPPGLPPDLPPPPTRAGVYRAEIKTSIEGQTIWLCFKPPVVNNGTFPDNGKTHYQEFFADGTETWQSIYSIPHTVTGTANCNDTVYYETSYTSISMKYGLVSSSGEVRIAGTSVTASGTTGGRERNSHRANTFNSSQKPSVFKLVRPNDDEEDDRSPPPPPPPPEKEDMKCCRQNDDVIKLLRKVAKVTGVSELPVTLPASFNGKRTGTEKIETIPQFVQWNALQTSDLIGAYPKKITIEDANLLEEGNQKVEIELPNLSEAIADMYGQSVRSAATAEVLLAFATKLAAEVCSVKAADLVTQSMVKSIAIAMGFKYNEEKTYVDFGFNFTEDASQVEDFLEPAEKKIITWRCEQEDSLWEYLQRLMFAASLVKAQTLRKETTGVGSALQRLVDAGLAGGTGLQEFIDKLNSEGFYNAKDGIKKPKIEELE